MKRSPQEIREEVYDASSYEDEKQTDPIATAFTIIGISVLCYIGLEIAARTPWIQRLFTPN